MTWHLKNKELEKKLMAIDPSFEVELNRICENLDSNKDGDLFPYKKFCIALRYKFSTLGEVSFHGSDIEN